MVRTGTGECGATASRTKSVATQTSSTCANPTCCSDGNASTSQYHMPIRWVVDRCGSAPATRGV